uniref:G-protein coupled receptors family 1 profile domain-containing protein n=1 Tax=Neogobius melanostomus TaxID=47308 RepID=A0A8C6TU04_9GOBI
KSYENKSIVADGATSLPWTQRELFFFFWSIAMTILYLIICVTGLAGNALVIAAILKLDKLSSSTTVYILNLALADGLFMVGLPFIASQNFQKRWVFGDIACKVVMVLDGINQFTSVFCLTAMSVDRYLALSNPLRFARWRTPRFAKMVSAILWLFSLLTIVPMALRFSAEQGLCILDLVSDAWWLGVLSYTFAMGFASPNRDSQRLERQVTKMVVAVVVAFGVCWLPFYTFNFCSLYQVGLAQNFARAFEAVVLLSYSWSCANPILYACFSDTFRRHFRSLLCPAQKSAPTMQCNTEHYDLNDTRLPDMTILP